MSRAELIAEAPAVAAGPFPALRKDLQVVPRKVRGRPLRYLLQDPRSGRVFELGEQEQFVCRQLDGGTGSDDVMRYHLREFGRPIDRAALEAFVRQLAAEGFLEGVAARAKTFPEIFNPEEFLPYARVRLMRGARLIEWLAERSGWLFGLPAKFFVTVAILLAVNIVVRDGSALWEALVNHWSPAFLLAAVALSCLFVQMPRAVVQGIACRRHGGHVSEIGLVLLYYVLPGVYCEYSDVAWVRDKRRRLRVLRAGLHYQLFVGAAATIGWFVTARGSLVNALWLALATASVAGLVLVIANPLVKMDGYHMLVTWLEVPRLRERALAAFGSWIRRRPLPEPLAPGERRWFLVFGGLVFLFAVGHLALFLVLAGLSLTQAYEGAGLVATALLGLLLFQRPLARRVRSLPTVRWLAEGGRRLGPLTTRGWTGLLIVAVVLLLPYPYETGGPFTVYPAQRGDVHCEIDGGRVAQVFVKEGDFVTAGQPLAQIDKSEYEKNLHVVQASLDLETLRGVDAEVRRLRALLLDAQRELDLTTLRAPMPGRVVTPMIQQTAGRYLKKGDLFATVEQAETVKVEVHVPEEDVPQVRVGARVKVVAWAYPKETFYGTVMEIAPIASTPVTPAALPRFNSVRVIAELPNQDLRLKSQLTGFAKIKTDPIPVWFVLGRLIIRWFQVQFWYWIP